MFIVNRFIIVYKKSKFELKERKIDSKECKDLQNYFQSMFLFKYLITLY